ncbi:hypothetical protein LINPERHAP1_LOCUS36485 [Linum perenne]
MYHQLFIMNITGHLVAVHSQMSFRTRGTPVFLKVWHLKFVR